MLSTVDLERLIAEKRREIEMEKSALGLSPPIESAHLKLEDIESNNAETPKLRKKVTLSIPKEPADDANTALEKRSEERETTGPDHSEEITAGLERYIRRYLGLPVMLKAGEFSPNNPVLREERTSGDALLGLGEYERRRNTLRKIRQQQYREYLDQQAKKKQEEKEKAERARRELEEKERQREEERERVRKELEQDTAHEQRLASVCFVTNVDKAPRSKVETGVQVGVTKPLSVAVQTDDIELYGLSHRAARKLTTAERELSPRCADTERLGEQSLPEKRPGEQSFTERRPSEQSFTERRPGEQSFTERRPGEQSSTERRPGEQSFTERRPGEQSLPDRRPGAQSLTERRPGEQYAATERLIEQCAATERLGERYGSDSRAAWDQQRDHWGDQHRSGHDRAQSPVRPVGRKPGDRQYMPSILDADAIRVRNEKAEKEAAERRQSYQQELRRQIEEQQRIRQERLAREKMLEQAEMRRLEEQLRMLKMAADQERRGQREITARMKHSASEYGKKRNSLQREIDYEQQRLRSRTLPIDTARLQTSRSENNLSQLPFYYPKDTSYRIKPPYSSNIPSNSIFSPTYDVDSYLRKNLNPSKEALFSNRLDTISSESNNDNDYDNNIGIMQRKSDNDEIIAEGIHATDNGLERLNGNDCGKVFIETAQIHEPPKDRNVLEKPRYEPSFLRKPIEIETRDDTPIPVLRHSPKDENDNVELSKDISDKMRLVEDKWKVPAVQKNILKTLPSEEGKSVSILTQLGSIRRQLQLEQMRLDNMKGTGK